MAKTDAERAREYRQRKQTRKPPEKKRDAVTVSGPERDENVTEPIGPLDVYSESRWAYLQSRGHKWDAGRQRSFRPDGVVGVTVPGDPAYQGVAV